MRNLRNETVEFQREKLNEQLEQLWPDQRAKLNRIFPDGIPDEKVVSAFDLCERTIAKNNENLAFGEWFAGIGRLAFVQPVVRDYSDINGNGYGSQHRWRVTGQSRGCTSYKCKLCAASFAHAYDETPNIFTAIREDGVPEFCDPKYPVMRFGVSWMYDKEDGTRERNGTSGSKMYRIDEAPTLEAYIAELFEWWATYEKKGSNPSEPEFTIEPVRHDTWYLSWFQHETFDVGLSDEEVLASFERFIRYAQQANYEQRVWVPASGPPTLTADTTESPYVLMGAEDRWRWCGAGDDGAPGTRTPPPCRCIFCKMQGKVRIGH